MTTSKGIYSQNFQRINSAAPISRESLISGISSDCVAKCWELMCAQVLRNFQAGKGTVIPKFGTFTFKDPSISLEGTTNQVIRDKKPRLPVFIVSSEFVQNIKPGIHSDKGSITHYEQKLNNGINLVKLNLVEISLSLQIGKAEANIVLDNLMKFLGDKIKSGEFKNKDMPGIGSLILRNKLLAVKFNNSVAETCQELPQKLNEIKKHISLSNEIISIENQQINSHEKLSNLNSHTNNYQNFKGIRNLPNLSKSVANLRPQSALMCKVTPDGEKWLKSNLNIEVGEIKEIPIQVDNRENSTQLKNFFNDEGKNIKIAAKKLKDLNLRNSILEDIVYQKSFIINQLKSFDSTKKGQLNKEQVQKAFLNARIDDLDASTINSILSLYMHSQSSTYKNSTTNTFISNNVSNMFNTNKVESTDYMNLMLLLVKDIKDILTVKNKPDFFSNNDYSNLSTIKKTNTSQYSKKNLNDFAKSFSNNLNSSYSQPTKTINSTKNKEKPNKKVNLEEVKTEIITIKTTTSNIKDKYSVRLGQIISSYEFCNILKEFSIVYPHDKIIDILNFLELDPRFFTLIDFFKNLDNCKILVNETLTEDIVKAIKQIKDIAYTNGGKNFFFPKFPEKQLISKSDFIKCVRSKLKTFSDELVEGVFYYITKMDRDLTYNDYLNYFESPVSTVNNNIFVNSESFLHNATEIIIDKMKHNQLKEEEYFERFNRFKNNRTENLLNRYDFHFALEKENFSFSAEERDIIFNAMDKKKDDLIDREEFVSFLKVVHDPLFKLQDTIKKNSLEIEEIIFRMNINANKPEVLDFWSFKNRMKLLNSTFSHEFVFALFLQLKNADDKVDTRRIIEEFNVFKKLNFRELNTDSFKRNFMNYYKKHGNFLQMKDAFEKRDSNSSGYLDKVEFSKVVLRFNKPKEIDYNNTQKININEQQNFENLVLREEDYKVEDVMKICRICELYGKDNKVNYTKFLELVFYDKNDNVFNLICDKLSDIVSKITSYINQTDKLSSVKNSNFSNYDPIYLELLNIIIDIVHSSSSYNSSNLTSSTKGISFVDFGIFLESKFQIKAKKSIIQLFDSDKNGLISIEDLKSILSRYTNNHYFKYEEIKEGINSKPNFYCEEVMSDEKFKLLVKDIKAAMKQKNLTDVGLFNKLDTNKDGFVTGPEFNANIDQLYQMSSNIKDQFYSYLDVRKLGLVDLDTFKKRFKEFSSLEVIVKNDWEIEEKIISEFNKYLQVNCLDRKLTIYEIFALLDFNCDGKVDISDFKKFVIEKMLFSVYDVNEFKVERVLQHISRSKLGFFTIHDIKEYINDYVLESNPLSKEYSNYAKEKFNVNNSLKGVDWLNSVFEKFGLYVTENYANFENFFEAVNKNNHNSEKIKLNDFLSFTSLNNLALKGFNLTQDEMIAFFTAFDAHKKSYISLQDVKDKLADFDFFKRMKLSVKTFIKNNFKSGVEAFKFFIDNKNLREDKPVPKYLTKKEFFDGIKNIFPDTYSTENIIKLINLNFKDENKITFSEFNYIFFDQIALDSNLETTEVFGRLQGTGGSLNCRPQSAKHNPKTKLVTPYDEDALEKLRRLLKSSRFNYDSFFKMFDVLNNGFVNQNEFRNMIKKLNIGITGLELDEIISKSGKNREGKISMSEFLTFLNFQDKNINQISDNVKGFVADLKQLIYKYYANPRLAFQFVNFLYRMTSS